MYKDATKEVIKEELKEVNEKIVQVVETSLKHESDIHKHDKRLKEVEKKIDDSDQRERAKNIIITGVPEGQYFVQKSIELMRSKMNIVVSRSDIKYGVRLGVEKDDNKNLPVRIVFKEIETKTRIYKSRTKLKGTSIWIAEDLTPRRSELAFKAREAVRQNKAAQTWTFGGTIFLKTKSKSRPHKVATENDIPK